MFGRVTIFVPLLVVSEVICIIFAVVCECDMLQLFDLVRPFICMFQENSSKHKFDLDALTINWLLINEVG